MLEVLNVGRLAPVKGQVILLAAAAELAGRGTAVRVRIAGTGPLREVLEQESERLIRPGLEIEMLGAVGSDRIPALYRSADVFCLSSFAEGVPVVLMEAMASGLPVIATRIAGIPELVEDGRSGLLVPPGSGGALADALAQLAGDPERRTAFAREGRRRVVEEFSSDVNARRMLGLMQRYLPGPRSG